MPIASRLKHHLDAKGLPFDMLPHPYTATASESAEFAHVPGDHLVRGRRPPHVGAHEGQAF